VICENASRGIFSCTPKSGSRIKTASALVKTLKNGVFKLGKNQFESKKWRTVKKIQKPPRIDNKKQLAFRWMIVYNTIVFNGQF
jgi:hypothetical protein